MIKKFLTFNNDTIKIGEYVYITEIETVGYGASQNQLKKLSEFLQHNIGIVQEIYDNSFYIKYYNFSPLISIFFTHGGLLISYHRNIKHHSENLETLKLMITANKYNI
jgi:hypothetical protein